MIESEQIKPKVKRRVIDLVREAGLDVSAWSNYSGGEAKAATNPKYCYEWSFIDSGRTVVLNLWHELMQVNEGGIFQELDYRRTAKNLLEIGASSAQVRRARATDEAVRTAFEGRLPVRVIVCDGNRRKERQAGASRVSKRDLDPTVWHVGAYDYVTGRAILVRGPRATLYVDQFSLPEQDRAPTPERRPRSGEVFIRSAAVRERVLRRADGRCELCGEPGFAMPRGMVYLETHHVVALSEGGPDTDNNVVALCPNHHRRAHYGIDRDRIRERLTLASQPGPPS